MIKSEIKPCPFCCEQEMVTLYRGTLPMSQSVEYYVICHSCRAQGPRERHPNGAIDAWSSAKEQS